MRFILGKKIEMSQRFSSEGKPVPVTLIKAGPCFVTQIKTKDKDGYEAVQIGFEELKAKKVKKPQRKSPFRYIKEFRINNFSALKKPSDFMVVQKHANTEVQKEMKIQKYKIGDKIDVSIFKPGEKVIVSGTSKGKGFAGVMKRHGFHGAPATHGTKHDHRHPGSIGSIRAHSGKIPKGKKMAGRMGNERVTIKNLEIIEVSPEKKLLVVKGAVSGARNSLVEIIAR